MIRGAMRGPMEPSPNAAHDLALALEKAAHFLPAQAPLEVFVHHNTLHAYQHLPFHDAVAAARVKTGARGYLSVDEYRDALRSGRIRSCDLDAALATSGVDLGSAADHGLPSRQTLARLVLVHDIRPTSSDALAWLHAEHDADRTFARGVGRAARERITSGSVPLHEAEATSLTALYEACCDLSRSLMPIVERTATPATFLRDLFISRGSGDPSELVHPVLVPACASFLDRGLSHWTMPDRERGFFHAWLALMTSGRVVRPAWLARLGPRLRAWKAADCVATDVFESLRTELGIADDQLDAFVEHTLFHLPGWAGMFHKLETAPGPIGRSHARVRLVDFLVVRLILDVEAARDLGKQAGHRGPLSQLAPFLARREPLDAAAEGGPAATAWPLFLLAQHAGLPARALMAAGAEGAAWMLDVVRRLDEATRLRIWHEAYERRYREELLHALAAGPRPHGRRGTSTAQLVFCIDDRAESMRRHVEELSPETETFGTAGFFNLAIAYRGIDDPSSFPLCPVVVEPQHEVEERAIAEHIHLSEARRRWRMRLGRLEGRVDRASHSMIAGSLLTAVAGAVVALPLLAEVFAPRLAARTRRAATRRLLPDLQTELSVPRSAAQTDEMVDGNALLSGFTMEEKAARVGTLLENIGLTKDFAPVVLILGHDSTSVNNPHFAAYSCGACGGRSGGPNARLFARMANRPEVRVLLRARGIDIPDATTFVGAVHDTSADTIRIYDRASLPPHASPHVEALGSQLDQALRRNAHERCRRFESAPRAPSLDDAHEHVERRSVDLSEPRPELGHVTNAACVVGRRTLTRGLFLDRRSFLVSYDPHGDERGTILERILLAVGPVCAGINLEYYFSTTDNERYGAGTKLPHNVTALVGVMNGASSDLRTGLPKQMIEIHEPIRLHLVVETSESAIRAVLERQASFRELVENEWLRLVLVDPASGAISLAVAGGNFVPWHRTDRRLPIVSRSTEWYAGRTGFVGPARVEPGAGPWTSEPASGASIERDD